MEIQLKWLEHTTYNRKMEVRALKSPPPYFHYLVLSFGILFDHNDSRGLEVCPFCRKGNEASSESACVVWALSQEKKVITHTKMGDCWNRQTGKSQKLLARAVRVQVSRCPPFRNKI